VAEPFLQTIQFYVAKCAAHELQPLEIRDLAKAKGIERVRYEYSEYRTPPGKGRLTCHRDLVELIAEAFIAIAERSKGKPLATEAALAAKAALDALGGR
jgi:hypothetical protein